MRVARRRESLAWRHLRTRPVRDVSLALTGAVLMGASAPPSHAWLAGLLVWVPLATIATAGQALRAAQFGWLQGIVAQAIVLAGIPGAVHSVSGTNWLACFALYLLLVVVEGGRQGLTGLLAARAVHRGWPLPLAFPAAVTTAELFYPLFFPWTTSLFVSSAPVFLQIADWGGRLAISFTIALAGAFLAQAAARGLERGRLAKMRNLGFAATIWIALATYGAAHLRDIDEAIAAAPPFNIAAVQIVPSDPPEPSVDAALAYRDVTLARVGAARPDLVVWPEAAIPYVLDADDLPPAFERLFQAPETAGSLRMDAPLLTGVMLRRRPIEAPAHVRLPSSQSRDAVRRNRYTNAAVLVAPEGRIRGLYEKQTLVALGEYIPGESAMPWLRRLFPWGGHLSAGSSTSTSGALRLGDVRLAVSICYEDILPDAMRAAVLRDDPDLLVNLTSDSWFRGSRIPYLHLQIAALRSVELRRFLAQATTDGITAAVDPGGRTIMALPPATTAAAIATVRRLHGTTTYALLGDAPWYGVAVALLAMILVERPRG